MTIYSHFGDRVDAALAEAKRPSSREATLVLAENEGGDPLLGIEYSCDFRSEEESGAGKMAETFTRAADPQSFFAQEYLLQDGSKGLFPEEIQQAGLILETDKLIAFAAETHIYDAQRELAEGLIFVREATSWKDGRSKLRRNYWHSTAVEMRADAKARGLKGYSKLKVKELESLLVEDDFAKANADKAPEEIISQPGWFHNGSMLVFEKKEGLFTEVLQHLVEAAKAGYLVVGGGGIGAFGSGFSLFDARDLSDESKAQITARNSWYREQMELLKPVAEIVNAGPMSGRRWGRAYFFLGRPTLFDDFNGVVKYWLNGQSVQFPNGRTVQPFGYYSLQELLDETYMAEAAAKSDEDFKRYTDKGSYRKTALTDEEAEAELLSRGLCWASKPMAKS